MTYLKFQKLAGFKIAKKYIQNAICFWKIGESMTAK